MKQRKLEKMHQNERLSLNILIQQSHCLTFHINTFQNSTIYLNHRQKEDYEILDNFNELKNLS